ncbi:MAG: cytochrome c oxidase accessory protein CcoG [Bacteroidota bacterium]
MANQPIPLTESPYDEPARYRDTIATVNEEGKRNWIYPKKPKGRFYQWRTYVSYGLLVVLFGLPWIKLNGEPLVLFNILERKFILLGIRFMPQDFHLFVLAMITMVVFITLFTVVFGRIFCGWICPQTIFMEMVFRKIEYWIEGDANAQKRLHKAPWDTDKIIKKLGKQMIFFAISVLVANTFLSYIIGIDQVIQIATEPIQAHFGGFVAMILFSFAFYGVFAYLREQVCVTICPYGRLQGVLMNEDSIVIAYDYVRGEPRGKIKRNRKKKAAVANSETAAIAKNSTLDVSEVIDIPKQGDCIDCKLCIQVCPTGIDIRNGTQLECINCTACIDACNGVMEKINKPLGLIRYESEKGISKQTTKIFTPRVIAYTVVLSVLIVANIALLGMRTDVESIILRTPGMLYQEVDKNTISNLYNYQVINKTNEPVQLSFELDGDVGQIRAIGAIKDAPQGGVSEGAFFIDLPKSKITNRKTKLKILVYSKGVLIDHAKTTFLGPI